MRREHRLQRPVPDQGGAGIGRAERRDDAARRRLGVADPEIAVFPGDDLLRPEIGPASGRRQQGQRRRVVPGIDGRGQRRGDRAALGSPGTARAGPPAPRTRGCGPGAAAGAGPPAGRRPWRAGARRPGCRASSSAVPARQQRQHALEPAPRRGPWHRRGAARAPRRGTRAARGAARTGRPAPPRCRRPRLAPPAPRRQADPRP